MASPGQDPHGQPGPGRDSSSRSHPRRDRAVAARDNLTASCISKLIVLPNSNDVLFRKKGGRCGQVQGEVSEDHRGGQLCLLRPLLPPALETWSGSCQLSPHTRDWRKVTKPSKMETHLPQLSSLGAAGSGGAHGT